MPFTHNLFEAKDLRDVKRDLAHFSETTTRPSMIKHLLSLSRYQDQSEETLNRWILMARAFSDETIDLFELGKINRKRLYLIAASKYPNPAYKDFIARKAVEENLTTSELVRIRAFVQEGRHPVEAIDIIRHRRPERPITKNDELEIEKAVDKFVRDGIDLRKSGELLKLLGKFQVIQKGVLKNRIVYSLIATKVAVDDLRRWIDEQLEQVPKEVLDAVNAEFRDEPVAQKPEGDDPAPRPPGIGYEGDAGSGNG